MDGFPTDLGGRAESTHGWCADPSGAVGPESVCLEHKSRGCSDVEFLHVIVHGSGQHWGQWGISARDLFSAESITGRLWGGLCE